MKETLATILLLSTTFVVSCKDDEPEAPPEHGTPSIRYQVMGSVTDEAGNPLKGIAVRLKDNFMNPAFKDPYMQLALLMAAMTCVETGCPLDAVPVDNLNAGFILAGLGDPSLKVGGVKEIS